MVTTTQSQSFFKPLNGAKPGDGSKSVIKAVLVDMGGNGDCGFRAVAAGLIDRALSGQRLSSALVAKVLARHFREYPDQRLAAVGLIKPDERIQQLIKQVSIPELVQTLAYTLRQIAVDEMCANPARYQGAFANNHEQTSPKMMRKSSTWIDESAMAALAVALDTPIEVKVVEHGKEIPMRLKYKEDAANPKIVVQLQGGHYIPLVTHAERFASVKSHQSRTVPMGVGPVVQDPDLQEIRAAIAQEDKQIQQEFEHTQHRLTAMVNAGELSKEELIDMYVNGMGASDYLYGRVKYVGIEHGNQLFFNVINQARSGVEIVKLTDGGQDKQVINELIHGIARAISVGQMTDSIYESNVQAVMR